MSADTFSFHLHSTHQLPRNAEIFQLYQPTVFFFNAFTLSSLDNITAMKNTDTNLRQS